MQKEKKVTKNILGQICTTVSGLNFTSVGENPRTEVLVIHARPVSCWYACLRTFSLKVYVSFVHSIGIVLVVSEWGSLYMVVTLLIGRFRMGECG